MEIIDTIEDLESRYGTPSTGAIAKVTDRLTPAYRRWIMASRYCIVASVGPAGTDASPRGEDGPVVQELDERTLLMPDWRGNNRLDTLRNIVRDGRVSLLFMVPGATTVVRVNGRAVVTPDEELRARFERNGRQPTTVILIAIEEVYVQCSKATVRADLWGRDDGGHVPSIGDILAEITDGALGVGYDETPDLDQSALW